MNANEEAGIEQAVAALLDGYGEPGGSHVVAEVIRQATARLPEATIGSSGYGPAFLCSKGHVIEEMDVRTAGTVSVTEPEDGETLEFLDPGQPFLDRDDLETGQLVCGDCGTYYRLPADFEPKFADG